jgi:hypothetical protein
MYIDKVVSKCHNCKVVMTHSICINCGYAPGIGYLHINKVREAFGYEKKLETSH